MRCCGGATQQSQFTRGTRAVFRVSFQAFRVAQIWFWFLVLNVAGALAQRNLSPAVFGSFRGFGDRSLRTIVLDRLLLRRWQVSHRYLLLVFVLIHTRIDQGCQLS